jgi:hypothetical protein
LEIRGLGWQLTVNGTGDPFIDEVVPLVLNGSIDLAGSFYYFIVNRASYLVPLMASHPEK